MTMLKWLFAALLVLQADFAASYLVPLDRQAQGEFGGLLRWAWPWSDGGSGPLGKLRYLPASHSLGSSSRWARQGCFSSHPWQCLESSVLEKKLLPHALLKSARCSPLYHTNHNCYKVVILVG